MNVKTKTEAKNLCAIIADGLDAVMSERGLGPEHLTAMRLADAAPDLLAALTAIVDYWDHPSSGPGERKPNANIEIARAALAKARGE